MKIGGHKTLFDFDLDDLYETLTRISKQAAQTNSNRFPKGRMNE